jgi:hypothetical protein
MISSTFEMISSELELESLFEQLSILTLLIPRSLEPIDGALASMEKYEQMFTSPRFSFAYWDLPN